MKQKTKPIILIICISLIAILSISSYALFHMKDQKKISNPKEVEGLAVLVDGEKTDTFPAKDSGKVFDKIECTNGGEAEWNSDTWKLTVRHINRSTECTVSFITKVQTGVEKLTELAKTNTTELFIDDTADANIRYMGKDPANYVDIGNGNDAEGNPILWRIIGVMNNVDDGTGAKETRIKLIREKSIGNLPWNTAEKNNWSTASLNTLLSNDYFNKKGDYTITGFETNRENLVKDAVYHLGGPTETSLKTLTASGYYEAERSEATREGNPATWTGKIGLMYPSDYGYATSGDSTNNKAVCAEIGLYTWGSGDCKTNDWLFTGTFQWTMTPSSVLNYNVMIVQSPGQVYGYNNISGYTPRYAFAVRPVVYLRSDVKITGGEGTKENPYTLGI